MPTAFKNYWIWFLKVWYEITVLECNWLNNFSISTLLSGLIFSIKTLENVKLVSYLMLYSVQIFICIEERKFGFMFTYGSYWCYIPLLKAFTDFLAAPYTTLMGRNTRIYGIKKYNILETCFYRKYKIDYKWVIYLKLKCLRW